MTMLLNPVLDGLEAARRAIRPDDEVMMDDQGDRWEFEFVPHGDGLGGGAQVWIAKDDFRVLRIVRGQ
jgi:hypothetical protein